MTVKDIVKSSAALLSREDVCDYLSGKQGGIGDDTVPTLNTMVTLLNLVISELSATYIPMVKREQVEIVGGKLYYTALKNTPLKVLNVYDALGKEIPYSENALYLSVSTDNAIVEYEFVPPNYGLEETIGYTEKDISQGALAFGLAAEYSICKGAFDEAVMWHKRYVESVNNKRKIENVKLKTRSWQ
ncbi:MAG: hypothetical protein IKB67_04405 [Clostridia bacterium]|nr:hypothetical protein [Clostridia bacterium]